MFWSFYRFFSLEFLFFVMMEGFNLYLHMNVAITRVKRMNCLL
uniref:Uncharacterized protein n=1 Tax=Rhizophora mucronata TaxID=61149 RepID=A0A2P2Q7Z1_RHIMU